MIYDDLVTTTIGSAVDRQTDLDTKLGEHHWQLNAANAMITFSLENGEKIESAVQFIGTHSTLSNTWVWSWGAKAGIIPKSNIARWLRFRHCFPPEAIAYAVALRELGEKELITELTSRKLQLRDGISEVNEWDLSLLAGGHFDRPVYRCPHRNGAMFVLIEDQELRSSSRISSEQLALRFGRAVTLVLLNQQLASFEAYAKIWGMTVTPHGSNRVVTDTEGQSIYVRFCPDGYFKTFNIGDCPPPLHETAQRYREFVGDAKFSKFVDALHGTSSRLLFWQQDSWDKFCIDTGVDIIGFKEIKSMFPDYWEPQQ